MAPGSRWQALGVRPKMEILPEFRVTLTRLKPGETAYPVDEDGISEDMEGQRTKLGGLPESIQGGVEDLPRCPDCQEQMLFVAQIDSVEHQWRTNPHSVEAGSKDQKWMFGDVGMIYVFFCKGCLRAHADFECY
jgi:hypothetical protein